MICPNCGQETIPGSIFCDNCGIRLNAPVDTDAVPQFDAASMQSFANFEQTEPVPAFSSATQTQTAVPASAMGDFAQPAAPASGFDSFAQPAAPASGFDSFAQPAAPASGFDSFAQPAAPASGVGGFAQPAAPASGVGGFAQTAAVANTAPSPMPSQPVEPLLQQFQQPEPAVFNSVEPQPVYANNAAAGNSFANGFTPPMQSQSVQAMYSAPAASMPPVPPVPPAPPVQPASGSAAQAAAPLPTYFSAEQLYPPVSLGNWIGTFLLLFLIPLAAGALAFFAGSYIFSDSLWTSLLSLTPTVAYIVMIFIYAFNRKVNPSKRNFFRAALVLTLICIILVGILVAVFGAYLASYLGDVENLQQVQQLEQLMNSIPV